MTSPHTNSAAASETTKSKGGRKRVLKPLPECASWQQLDLFGSDPHAANEVLDRSEAASLDVEIALEVNPQILETLSESVSPEEAKEVLTFARFARMSGAQDAEMAAVLEQIGAQPLQVMEQLAEVEKLMGDGDEDIDEAVFSATLEDDDGVFHAELDDEADVELGTAQDKEVLASTALSSLMRQLKHERHTPPTEQEERALAARIREGDIEARNELVTRSMRFLVFCAKRYRYTGRPLETLIAFGAEGLIRAAELFDPDQARFSTYAADWIRQKVQREVLKDNVITTPANLASKESKLRRAAEGCTDPDQKALMIEKADSLRQELLSRRASPTSLDTAGSDSDDEPSGLHNLFASEEAGPDEIMERRQLLSQLMKCANSLEGKHQRDIFLMHLGLHEEHLGEPISMPAMTEHIPLGRERIRQLYMDAAWQVCNMMESWAKGADNLPNGFRDALKGHGRARP